MLELKIWSLAFVDKQFDAHILFSWANDFDVNAMICNVFRCLTCWSNIPIKVVEFRFLLNSYP